MRFPQGDLVWRLIILEAWLRLEAAWAGGSKASKDTKAGPTSCGSPAQPPLLLACLLARLLACVYSPRNCGIHADTDLCTPGSVTCPPRDGISLVLSRSKGCSLGHRAGIRMLDASWPLPSQHSPLGWPTHRPCCCCPYRPAERVVSNLPMYGNTSAASIPLALDEAVRRGDIKPGHVVSGSWLP